jgi:hypothetical protein
MGKKFVAGKPTVYKLPEIVTSVAGNTYIDPFSSAVKLQNWMSREVVKTVSSSPLEAIV